MNNPILFLPGLLCDQRLFASQLNLLQGKANTIVANLGHADSISQLATDIAKNHLNAADNWDMVALSMGGYVGFELLRQFPNKFSKVVIMNSSARADTEEQGQTRRGLISLAEQGNFKGVTPRLLPRLLHKNNLENKDLTDLIQVMAKDMGKDAFIRQQKAIMGRIDSRPSLRDFKQQFLVLGGSHDILTPPEILHEISTLLPKSEFHIIEDVAHLPPLESPNITNNFIGKFLLN